MFGYVKPLISELKVKEYNLFKSYYCSLCFSIKENFGNIPIIALNYDMTFLAIILDSLNEDKLKFNHLNLFYNWCNKIFNSITKFRMMYNKMNCWMSIF